MVLSKTGRVGINGACSGTAEANVRWRAGWSNLALPLLALAVVDCIGISRKEEGRSREGSGGLGWVVVVG